MPCSALIPRPARCPGPANAFPAGNRLEARIHPLCVHAGRGPRAPRGAPCGGLPLHGHFYDESPDASEQRVADDEMKVRMRILDQKVFRLHVFGSIVGLRR